MLSARQYAIAKRWAESTLVLKEMAEELHISQSTIRNHMQAVYRHFGLYGCTARLELSKIYADTRWRWRDWPTFLKWRSHE
jgi:DNA-binding CsgD family transcriptional regulator